MDTTTPAAGSSPAPEPSAPAAPAATPTPAPAPTSAPASAPTQLPSGRELAESLTPSERRDFALGKRTLPEIAAARPAKTPAPAPTPATTTPPAPAAEVPAVIPEPTPAANPEANPTPAAPEAGELPDRFRFKDEADQTIALLAKTKNISLLEAAELYRSDPKNKVPATPAPTPAVTPATPPADPELTRYDSDVSALEAKLTKLSDDRKKAREDVEMEKADSLSDEIARTITDLTLLKNERQGYIRNREAATVRTFEQQTNASHDRFVSAYPELKAEGSLHRLALEAYVSKAIADPNRAHEFNDPNWPEKIGAEFVEKHGLKKAASAATTPAAPTPGATPAKIPTPTPTPALRPKPQQVPGARSLTSGDGTTPSARVVTPEQLKADLARMSPAQRKELAVQSMAARPR